MHEDTLHGGPLLHESKNMFLHTGIRKLEIYFDITEGNLFRNIFSCF